MNKNKNNDKHDDNAIDENIYLHFVADCNNHHVYHCVFSFTETHEQFGFLF